MIPEAKRAQIIEALKSNPNRLAVARQVGGVSHETVCVIARKLGIGLDEKGPKRFSSEDHAKIAAALRANPNATAVAKEIGGISPGTVSAIAKEANIPLAAENLAKAKRLSRRGERKSSRSFKPIRTQAWWPDKSGTSVPKPSRRSRKRQRSSLPLSIDTRPQSSGRFRDDP
jgi:hypothetical protein